jgi:flagellar M-ring protein FliF
LKNDIKDRIQSSLSAILPAAVAGTNSLLRVTVTDYLDMPVAPLPEASLVQTLTAWLATQWQSVAMLGLAAAALMSIRSFAKVGATTDDSAFDNGFGIPLDEATDLDLADLMAANQTAPGVDASGQPIMGGSAEADGSPQGKKFGNKSLSGSDIRDQLSEMVRENPDAAATLLKSWIGESN